LKSKKLHSKSLVVFFVLFVFFLVASVWTLFLRLEGEKPYIETGSQLLFLNESQDILFEVSDTKSGLRRIFVTLEQEGKEVTLYEKDFSGDLLTGKGNKNEISFSVIIEPETLGFTEGKAILRIVAIDYSWRGWFQGNITYDERELIIDTEPPEIDVITRAHNISYGGAGLLIYRLSEPCSISGVNIEKDFFPGYSGYYKDPDIFLSFFALDYKNKDVSNVFVQATDKAGNRTRKGFYYHIRGKTFKHDVLNISDSFLQRKMPEFESDFAFDPKASMKEKYIIVNNKLRKGSYQKISELANKTNNVLYWDGPFLRLKGSATMAGFADHRTYMYHGKIIDKQVHMGVDLASLAHASVSASNNGKVVLAKYVGIYGKTVIIDHGFGLFSMYAHLSSISVKAGQMASKGDNIGKTGMTGLAGGDHLHFSMIVNKTFVNPIEWWDAEWIKNNISSKINAVTTQGM